MSAVRIGVAGALGRMGRSIAAELSERDDASLGGVWERPGMTQIGQKYDDSTLILQAGPESLQSDLDVVIDFTTPKATRHLVSWCAERDIAMVVGTTGLEAVDHQAIDQAAARIPIVQAPNMSVGVNVLCAAIELAARLGGPGFDLEIVETHHRMKRDAPSGTALRLLDVLRSVRTESEGVFARHGQIGARADTEIGVQTLRGGDVVGEHTVFMYGAGERLELTHRATDRRIFAAGALRAAVWLRNQPAGRYTMADVLAGS